MSKRIVHVGVPYKTEVACGMQGASENGTVRESITCRLCKKTEHYKNLGNARKVKR